jgi:hypothetical protein
MIKDNKYYYYPSDTDICIGLECEELVAKDTWQKRTLNRGDFLNYIPFSDTTLGDDSFAQLVLQGNAIIRIKRLDESDLKEICGDIKEELNTDGVRQYSGVYEGKEVVLIVTDLTKSRLPAYVSIYTGSGNALFHGRIRDKQELLRILEMVS